jgi:hypothetical protein
MKRLERTVILLAFLLLFFALSGANGQQQSPGNEPYTPSKIEWAALELQVRWGEAMTEGSPVVVSYFVDYSDRNKSTILCIITIYSRDYPAAYLKIKKEVIEDIFSRYKEAHKWPWLKLKIEDVYYSDKTS